MWTSSPPAMPGPGAWAAPMASPRIRWSLFLRTAWSTRPLIGLSRWQARTRTWLTKTGHFDREPVGALLQQGSLDFRQAEKRFIVKEWALALGFLQTSAKAHDQVQLFPGALKRSSPA